MFHCVTLAWIVSLEPLCKPEWTQVHRKLPTMTSQIASVLNIEISMNIELFVVIFLMVFQKET